MGGTTFGDYQAGTDVAEAFRAAREEAQYERGHGGYTGTIAEKDGYLVISSKPVTRDEAERMGEELIRKRDQRVDDKWGPAGAIAVKTGERTVVVEIPEKLYGYKSLDAAALAALEAAGVLREGEEVAHGISGGYSIHPRTGLVTGGTINVALKGGPEEFTGWWFFGWASC